MTNDENDLRLLSIFHYVVGGITALLACFPFIHLAFGIAIVCGAMPSKQPHLDAVFGWLFIIVPAAIILIGWSLAAAIVVAGRRLARRTHYMFCFVVAATECIVMPFGTVLGVFTLIVLNRPAVKSLFKPSE